MMKKHFNLALVAGLMLGAILAITFSCSKKGKNEIELNAYSVFEKVASELNFPEGPAWDGHGTLYVSNCYGNWITKINNEGPGIFLTASEDPFTFQKTNGLTVFRDGSLFACDFGRGMILRISRDGTTQIYADGYEGRRFNRPNDLAFDADGNLYFSDPNAYRAENPDGAIYRVAAITRKVSRVADSLAFPNGLAFSNDAKFLYVAESAFQRIVRFRVLPGGSLAEKKVFVVLPGGDPDGMNFDRKGNLYVAHFGGGAVYVIAPDGKIIKKLLTPGKKPSNVEFGDSDLRTLFVTEVETNAVYKIHVKIPGLPLFSLVK
ncbi:MAG TPA: SMP-30/gluconolactonase/LRE family protein [bacterium]